MSDKTNYISFETGMIPLIVAGIKTVTYRLCTDCSSFEIGDFIEAVDRDGNAFAVIKITGKSQIPFSKVPLKVAGRERYRSRSEVYKVYRQYCKRDPHPRDPVTVLHFKIVRDNEMRRL